MTIEAILAADNNGVIGLDNKIPWFLPDDLKFFKRTTMGHTMLMGRKCWESLGRPLPGRHHLVMTRDPFYVAQGIHVVHDLASAIQWAVDAQAEKLFIIGGAEIYKLTEHIWDVLYYTQVNAEVQGDTYYNDIDWDQFKLIEEIPHGKDERHPYEFSFKTYERIK
jgi:dihydrofolate reductase